MKIWCLRMPGLTGDILLEEAYEQGLFLNGQMTGISDSQWNVLERRCQQRLGLPDDWSKEKFESAKRFAMAQGWGRKYGPPTHGGEVSIRKKDLREDKKITKRAPIVLVEESDQEKLW